MIKPKVNADRAFENAPQSLDDESIQWPKKHDLIGVNVSQVNYGQAVDVIAQAAQQGTSGVVACHAVHAIVTMSCDSNLREMANNFHMITPDGQPVRWALNLLHRTGLKDRVYGPELMMRLCHKAAEEKVSIYLYGGNERVSKDLVTVLNSQIPGLIIAGAEAPPFRPLTTVEEQQVVNRINNSGARIVFIGLGCPRQDLFAHQHRDRIKALQVCVGAAFDFHAGIKPMAPKWMQRNGLEWMFRLWKEPRRLWKRYLVTNSLFIWKVTAAWIRG